MTAVTRSFLAAALAVLTGCGAQLPGFEVGGGQPTVGGQPQQSGQAPKAAGDQERDALKPSAPLAYTEVAGTDLQQPILRLAANPQVKRLYALQGNRSPLAVLDAASGQVISTIPIGANPTDLAVEPVGNRLYVTDSADGLRVIDTVAQSVVQQVSMTGARAIEVDRAAGRVYVLQTQTPSNPERIRVFDLAGASEEGAIAADPGYGFGAALAADPVTHRLYVGRVPRAQGSPQIAAYDGMTRAFVAAVNVPAEAAGMVAGDGRLYAAIAGKERGVAILDTAANKLLAFVKSTTGGPFIAVRGTRAYTAGPGANVQVFDLALRRWVGEYAAAGDVVVPAGGERIVVAGKDLTFVAETPAKDANPSFETDANGDGLPDSWTGTGLGPADRLTTEKALDGARAMTLSGGTKSLRQTLALAGKKDERISLMAWAQPKDAAADATVKAVVRYAGGQMDTITLTFKAKPEAWQVQSAVLRARDAFDRVTITIEYGGPSGLYWFDYVLLGAPLSGDAKVTDEK